MGCRGKEQYLEVSSSLSFESILSIGGEANTAGVLVGEMLRHTLMSVFRDDNSLPRMLVPH